MEVAMLQQEISKRCADSLRTLTKEQFGIKLKAAHAHELVAAYFGYNSKNAMLADEKYPISNLEKAKVIVMISDSDIDRRRMNLQDLSEELPDSYTLGEAFYTPLFSDPSLYTSELPPFRSLQKAAEYLIQNDSRFKSLYKSLIDIPMEHIVSIEEIEDKVVLTVIHGYRASDEEISGAGETILTLPRIAGKIGFGSPEFKFTTWSGAARKTIKLMKGGEHV
jgi:hypothetical protein